MRNTGMGPPIAARAFALTHTCIFDAWAAYDPVAVGTRLGGTLRRQAAEHTLADKQEAISFLGYVQRSGGGSRHLAPLRRHSLHGREP
ncbi:MAG: DUF6851 domain-containing protein [Blastocatellia bacterium]